MEFDLSGLNEEQIKPVLDTEGAVLVTAGAGSGKTRLLTHRIAHLIKNKGVRPYNILAITFTNKAAGEMRERLSTMLKEDAGDLWVFTFHALCVRVLRRFITLLGGYTPSFSIYGEDEKEHLIKRILKGMEVDASEHKSIICAISDAKSYGQSPDEYGKIYSWRDDVDTVVRAYAEYEKELKKANALDYDDLLIKAHTLLKGCSEAREYYQKKFHYIHVDEFQDTNKVQYDIVKLLAGGYGNVFVVGDEDQSIYGWRGANFRNIFDFTSDFKCRVYKLEQNYRSTKKILALANKIIVNNKSRLDKRLWTQNEDGADVKYYPAASDRAEADFVIGTIKRLCEDAGCKYSDFAVLMRINALSRAFEERMLQYGIPHKVYGGFKFYDRKEVKDLLAYLKIIGNHSDDEAILRVINFPKRGIGDGTVAQLQNYAKLTGQRLYDVIYGLDTNLELPMAVIKKASSFSTVLKCMDKAYRQGVSLFDLVCYIIKLIGLREYYAEDTEENAARKENIRELAHSVEQFQNANPDMGLDEYLQQISLYSDTDDMDDSDCVTLATVHSAKGLEFDTVFVVGLEEEIFPSSRADDGESDKEEERRLMYVAVTRAKKRLYLSMAKTRFRFGEQKYCLPSCFLREGGFVDDDALVRRARSSDYDGYAYRGYGGARSYQSSYGPGYNAEEIPLSGGGEHKEYKLDFSKKTSSVETSQVKDFSRFRLGVKVRHKKFGEGEIVKVIESGNAAVEVLFPGVGKLMLLLAYAPLEIVE